MSIISIDIDAQKTFTPLCPNELPVTDGDKIVAELNKQAKLADFRVMSKDAHSPTALWICEKPEQIGEPTGLPEADQKWVAHGIVGSYGYELLDGLPQDTEYDFCIWKGVDPKLHPYGACFHDLSEKLSTGLLEWLHSKQAKTILIGGLATDYCVKTTVLQLLKNNPNKEWLVIVNKAACRGIAEDTTNQAWIEMQKHGAMILENAEKIAEFLKK
ncbi:MAG: isochorismatase family protein [Cardiobacteriaceae bacterium]|nr:isochorismatase family protein [Cardiobacteriaceae bacterium]